MAKILAIAMVAEHFHASFGQAIGIVTCGGSLGVTVMAPVMQLFLETYGLKGALILLGAINAHIVVCGALLRTPKEQSDHLSTPKYEHLSSKEEANSAEDSSCSPSWVNRITTVLNSTLFSNQRFLCLLTFHAIKSFVAVGWVVYLVSLTSSKGISPYLSAVIASIGGLGGIPGKLITPVFIDRKVVPSVVVYYAGFLTMSVSLVGHAVLSTFTGLSISSLFYGISDGALSVVIYKDCKTSVNANKMTEAFAWLEIAAVLPTPIVTILTGKYFIFTLSTRPLVSYVLISQVLKFQWVFHDFPIPMLGMFVLIFMHFLWWLQL